MLKYEDNKWLVTIKDLITAGARSPQGFTLELDFIDSFKSYYWTTDELAARLFYEKYGLGCPLVKNKFSECDDYLYNLSQALDTDARFKCPKGLEYRSYQNVAIEYLLNTKNALLADAMRAGKTISALGYINESSFKDIIIVAPKTVKLGWFNECKKWLLNDYHIQVVNSKTEVKPANIHIINYDIIHTKIDLLTKNYDLIILDEVHLAKNLAARRSKYVYGLKGKHKLGLSGTPLINKPKDFLTVLQWLDPQWERFTVKNNKFLSSSGLVLTLEQVQRLARSSVMIRREDSVLDNEPIEHRVVELLPDDDVLPLIKAELKSLSDYGKVSKSLGLSKVRLVLNHIDVYTTDGEKIVVFAYHKEVIKRIAASLGSKAEVVFGESSEAERQHAIDRFQNDPSCQVIVGSIPAMSQGIKLAAANHIIFAELDWSPGMMDQAASRCTDKDQPHPVLAEYLVYKDSLDYYKLNKLEYKGEVADAATNC